MTGQPFTLTVPSDAGAGEYITSLILENDEPIAGSGGIAPRWSAEIAPGPARTEATA